MIFAKGTPYDSCPLATADETSVAAFFCPPMASFRAVILCKKFWLKHFCQCRIMQANKRSEVYS